MALVDRFKNKSSKSVLPDEVGAYYKTTRQERRGVAVLLGIITLVVTLLIAALIFYGGRAAYRAINGSEGSKTGQTATSPNSNDNKKDTAQPAKDKKATNSQSQPSQTTTQSSSTNSRTQTRTPELGDSQPMPSTGDLPATGDPGQ